MGERRRTANAFWAKGIGLAWRIGLGLIPLLVLVLSAGGSAANTVRLVRMDPSGEVPARTNFTFIFSGDVVGDGEVGKFATTDKIRFQPAVPGRIRWETRSRLLYYPETTLLPSTAYTVELAADLPAGLKKTLTGKRKLEFTTQRFRVLDGAMSFIYPRDKKGLFCQARLVFNYPVDAEALQRNLAMYFKENRQPIKFTVQLANGWREALVTSELLQRSSTARRVELSVAQGFVCRGGSIGLAEKYILTAVFRERQALRVTGLSVDKEGGRNRVLIHFSEPPDGDGLEEFISIEPQVKASPNVLAETVALVGDFKAGRSYRIKVAKGLPALNGTPLERDYSGSITLPNLEPSVSFNSPGRYLSSKGHLNLGLETVNVSQVEVEIAKIYANNIVTYLSVLNNNERCYSSDLQRLGQIIERRTIQIARVENEVVTTPVNLRDFLDLKRRGIFQVTACDPEYRWRDASKVVIVTDLGIMAKSGPDELTVWVNSLDTLAPVAGARVSLYSYNNQELLRGETDARGLVRFTGTRRQLEGFKPYVILAEHGDDLSFVRLQDGLIDKTDFPVGGRPQLIDGYEAFLYLDRGVFRPGDAANIVAVVRGPGASVPPEFPVRLEIVGPDGMVFREFSGSTREAGVCHFNLEIPDYARTGQYTALLNVAKQEIGRTTFSVEEFMPDRIKVEALTDKDRYTRGERASIVIRGTNLYGPPAAGRRADLAVRLEAIPFSPPQYRSYTFGDPALKFAQVDQVAGQGELDANGEARFDYVFPADLNPPGLIRAIFQATVTEEGGRAVSSYKTVEYHVHQAHLGLRRRGDYYAKVGEDYEIGLVVVDRDGKPIPGSAVDVEIYTVTWNSIYRRDQNGRYSYQSERQEERVGKDAVKLGTGEGVYRYRPVDWGCFKLVFTDAKTGARSSFEFYATGWGYAPWAMDHPDRIDLDLEKASYKPGETARIQIRAPFAGRALVTVEREKVYEASVIELKENTGVITVPVKDAYKPNVYVSVHLIRAVKNLDKRAPTRAFGTVPLTVDSSANKLTVTMAAPGEFRPNQELEVTVAAAGGRGSTYLTLAAVDEGICQLTGFTTPDPWGYFYGKRALSLDTYDLYGMLLPEVEAITSQQSPAGDEAEEGIRRRNLNPVAVRRVKPVSLWSGLVKLDASGRARIKLPVPQFNGTLRLMAVAVSGNSFGSATGKVLVREPIVMTSTYPRFLAPGDRAVIPVTVFNGTGKDGTFTIGMTAAGPVKIDGHHTKELVLAKGQEKTVNYAVIAEKAAGACRFTLLAQGNGMRASEETELAVRPPQPAVGRIFAGSATAAKPASIDLSADWLPGSGEYALCLAPMPSLRFAGGLRFLLAYPYGCLEQTTSKLFPLLYFQDLARFAQPDLLAAGKVDYYLAQGIERLSSMQLRDGGFSFWPGSDYGSDWGSVYAAHFLVEARKAGYTVPDRVYDRMLDFLLRLSKKTVEGSWSLQLRVYSLYVLSLAGKQQLSSMAYIRNNWLDRLYPDSRALLAAAYFYAGDRKTARDLLPNTFAASTMKREKGGNFNSTVRTQALILSTLADVDPGHPAVAKLIQGLADSAKAGCWYTTQENAFAFMALGKIFQQKQAAAYTGEVLVNGERIAVFDSKAPKRIADPRLGRGKVTIRITGTGDCYYYAETWGVPLRPVTEEDKGLSVRREIYDRAGQKADLKHIKQGDLLVVKITVKTTEHDVENVAIVDMLPAGLEIENPRLASSARIGWLSADTFTPSYMDIRDDRLLLFASFNEAGTRHFYYAARAVSCGSYTLPPIKADCMYEPEVYSISGAGTVVVEK